MKLKILFLVILVFHPGLLQGEERDTTVPVCRLQVSFDISRSLLTGIAELPVAARQQLLLQTGALSVNKVEVNGVALGYHSGDGMLRFKPAEKGTARIHYTGLFKGIDSAKIGTAGSLPDVIDSRGISLTGIWHPRTESLMIYRLTALLPPGYEAVSEAEEIIRVRKGNNLEFRFEFPHPLSGLTLVASNRFRVTTEQAGNITLASYFFPEDENLAKTYRQHAREYLRQYETLLTPYPYRRFAIVENFLPTGYSMPTFTLLGQDVVRLPFIVRTSLGHEILHQWFGNSVYIDYDRGNWAEGLTTYLSDHDREEREGRGWQYRKQMLIDYGAYVNAGNEFPLRNFRSRTDSASRAIGYGKAAMVFHMLRTMAGDDGFFKALRTFLMERQYQRASWDDLQRIFEKQEGQDLSWFFTYWLEEKGLPAIQLENVSVRQQGAKFETGFESVLSHSPKIMSLPVTLSTGPNIVRDELLTLTGARQRQEILTSELPFSLAADRNYDIARDLAPDELPPVIAQFLGDKALMVVLPKGDKKKYALLISYFSENGIQEVAAEEIRDANIKNASLLILGRDNPVVEQLFGGLERESSGFSILVKKNPWNNGKVIGIIQGESAEEVERAFPKLFHYGKYSFLSFNQGVNVEKQIDPSQRGMNLSLRSEPEVIVPSTLTVLNDIIAEASQKKIVYIGENHQEFSHHHIQLQIISSLHKKNGKLAIGMEMFQRPFQPVVDDYINGFIDERTFLKRSEYFRRWAFDYNLYKPILDYARAEKIPVIALNMRREIIAKVSAGGLDSLTKEERADVPRALDFSNPAYRERIRQAFGMHDSHEARNFDFFLQAQVLWDETMAQSVSDYLSQNPDYQMVVLAGNGHVMNGTGIPQRALRRNGLSYCTILNDIEAERGIADFLVYPQSLEGLTSPMLMISIREEKENVIITGFAEKSVAREAGLKEGDIITALDGEPVRNLYDIKLALFFRRKGDSLAVSVIRHDELGVDQVMALNVAL